MARSYSTDLRERVVNYVESGGNKSDASRIFQISRQVIYQWLQRYEETDSLLPGKARGNVSKVAREKLESYVKQRSDDYLHEIGEALGHSKYAIHRALKRYDISYKKNHSLRRAKRTGKSDLSTGS
jgi:putative transposase